MKEKFCIADKKIGSGEPCFIIVEVGSNHNQNIEQAKKLIDVAADSGVDAVKFQLFKADILYSLKHPAYKIVKENEFPREWLGPLIKYANRKGLIFLAAPFDLEAVDLLEKHNAPVYKIASSEIVNLSFLRYVAQKKKPMILSTGMCNIADIYEAIESIKSAGNEQVALLQCSALYPTRSADVHLRVMDTLRGAFNVPVGFSDHTLGISIPLGAVARGACLIEKHFTLSRSLKGPDHFYAIEPQELIQMVKDIRAIEKSLGSAEKCMLVEEKKLARRESLFAKQNISKGVNIKDSMIVIQRPAKGLDARFLKLVIGKKAKKDIKKGDPIDWRNF